MQIIRCDLPCWVVALGAGFLGILLGSHSTYADAPKHRLDVFLSEIRTLRADFEQVLLDERFRRLETARGTLLLWRPGHFRWDYSEPFLQVILANQDKVWIYDSELAQVTVKPLGEAVGNTPALLLTSDRPLQESFFIKDRGQQGKLQWLELTPKSTEANFSKISLGFAGRDLVRMELKDNFGQTTQLRFSNITRNLKLDPAVFSFTPPPGVDILDEGE